MHREIAPNNLGGIFPHLFYQSTKVIGYSDLSYNPFERSLLPDGRGYRGQYQRLEFHAPWILGPTGSFWLLTYWISIAVMEEQAFQKIHKDGQIAPRVLKKGE